MNKKLRLLGMSGGIIVFLLFLSVLFLSYETVKYPDYVSAATSSAVTVSAVVTEEISCSTPSGSTAFGTLSSGSIITSSPNATTTMSCANVGGGCTLYVKDAGGAGNPGLATTSPAYLIPSPNAAFDASTTLVIGTEGYGIQAATTTDGSGAQLSVAARYLLTGNNVGGLTITNTTMASTSATTSGRVIDSTHKAAISGTTQAGAYEDTITYECTST